MAAYCRHARTNWRMTASSMPRTGSSSSATRGRSWWKAGVASNLASFPKAGSRVQTPAQDSTAFGGASPRVGRCLQEGEPAPRIEFRFRRSAHRGRAAGGSLGAPGGRAVGLGQRRMKITNLPEANEHLHYKLPGWLVALAPKASKLAHEPQEPRRGRLESC